MAVQNDVVRITRWRGGQHPTLSGITRMMKSEGLRPYMWMNMPNHRYAVRSHGYSKVLFVVEGNVELVFPDSNQRVVLRAGGPHRYSSWHSTRHDCRKIGRKMR